MTQSELRSLDCTLPNSSFPSGDLDPASKTSQLDLGTMEGGHSWLAAGSGDTSPASFYDSSRGRRRGLANDPPTLKRRPQTCLLSHLSAPRPSLRGAAAGNGATSLLAHACQGPPTTPLHISERKNLPTFPALVKFFWGVEESTGWGRKLALGFSTWSPESSCVSSYFPESLSHPRSPTPRSRPLPLLPVPPSPPPCLLGPPKSPPQALAADGSASPARPPARPGAQSSEPQRRGEC